MCQKLYQIHHPFSWHSFRHIRPKIAPKIMPNVIYFVGMEFDIVKPKLCQTFCQKIGPKIVPNTSLTCLAWFWIQMTQNNAKNGAKCDIYVWHIIWHRELKTMPNTSSIYLAWFSHKRPKTMLKVIYFIGTEFGATNPKTCQTH